MNSFYVFKSNSFKIYFWFQVDVLLQHWHLCVCNHLRESVDRTTYFFFYICSNIQTLHPGGEQPYQCEGRHNECNPDSELVWTHRKLIITISDALLAPKYLRIPQHTQSSHLVKTTQFSCCAQHLTQFVFLFFQQTWNRWSFQYDSTVMDNPTFFQHIQVPCRIQSSNSSVFLLCEHSKTVHVYIPIHSNSTVTKWNPFKCLRLYPLLFWHASLKGSLTVKRDDNRKTLGKYFAHERRDLSWVNSKHNITVQSIILSLKSHCSSSKSKYD